MLDKQIFEWAGRELDNHGIADRSLNFILYGMMVAGLSYQESLQVYSDYLGEVPERLHATNCYRLLGAGVDDHPAKLLEHIKKGWDNANRVFAGERG